MSIFKSEKQKKIVIIIIASIIIIGLVTAIILFNIKEKKENERIYNNYDYDNNSLVSYDEILVNVTGEVNRPGIYSIKNGSIVSDAIRLAGGFTKDADDTSINLISKLKDGDKILVKRKASSDNPNLININTASVSELMQLPGIGEAKANAIVTYREKYGKFTSIEEIMNVTGISESVYLKIKDSITV